jgi:hypothetical protein
LSAYYVPGPEDMAVNNRENAPDFLKFKFQKESRKQQKRNKMNGQDGTYHSSEEDYRVRGGEKKIGKP